MTAISTRTKITYRVMIIPVEAGEIVARVEGDRVVLTILYGPHAGHQLELSPLAAHNLGVVLPDLAREASDATLAGFSTELGRPFDTH